MNIFQKHCKTNSFRRCAPLLFLVAGGLCAQQAGTDVTIQLVLQQPGGKTGTKRESFSKQAKPGPGRELRVLVQANRECDLSFAAFTRDGQLVYGTPETVHLPAHVVKEFPASKKWTFEGNEHLAELDAVIADPAAADYKDYSSLVGKMSLPGISNEVWQAQARKLRVWIDGHLQPGDVTDWPIKENPVPIGGIIRGELDGPKFVAPLLKTSIVRITVH